ncbi:hypothetical protein CHGG_04902 [Chaetomium globosum CBS 148.51]|uniref:chitin synthase n=1 Tax=Chaetomium globosum (strain ATCC 6205 / CBS 148.51 / DSM 1962 / NBRC 6347 / NRRL 1970) TaxID=306901 RepID=Q2GZZ4_CHAGB|nr:uncharacterized protein CHGG_04902 [Chaetomium globosum CBS 148.51]EAQ88283.1 hypothetical protein CHGG_04902 [Chaetomium globosum CBS 148.51]
MIQVYEYYISHNLSKAFESLFGSVTCLPGCFSMYRIRAAETGKPLFVSREIVEAYSTIRVDTLHMKNLLHLGEDRYLTTLLLKFHNKYKTKYIFRAHAWTIAPDSWQVFLSQRRRWINSTPVTIAYIVYLIVMVAQNATVVPITAFVLLGAIYGLQAIIFILRRKWEMIGWMILYVLAVPVFSFALPLYSFWHMDDFNWGNTRVVAGEKGQKIVISDEGKFDPASIPRKKWEEYQAELWEAQTQAGGLHDDTRSEMSGYSYATRPNIPMSEYGGYTPSRPGSMTGYPGMPTAPSRMSLAASEMLGNNNRQSQFGGSQFLGHSQSQQELEMANLAGLPSDDALLAEIREILRTADLMTVTKKGVKLELEKRFGVPLDFRRAYINSGEF